MVRHRRRSCEGFDIGNLGQSLDRQHGCDVYKDHCGTSSRAKRCQRELHLHARTAPSATLIGRHGVGTVMESCGNSAPYCIDPNGLRSHDVQNISVPRPVGFEQAHDSSVRSCQHK